MSGLWVVLPPWIYSVIVTLLGRWGDARWAHPAGPENSASIRWSADWGAIFITNLIFMSLVPTSLLSVIHVMLPFTGARAGLSLGLMAFLFGCIPIRLLEISHRGWDRTLWAILIDLLRVGGALLIVGWLVAV